MRIGPVGDVASHGCGANDHEHHRSVGCTRAHLDRSADVDAPRDIGAPSRQPATASG